MRLAFLSCHAIFVASRKSLSVRRLLRRRRNATIGGISSQEVNHAEHITLSTTQQAALNRIKQKALLSQSTAQRKIDEAEQELWELTGADEPDAALIESKVQTIEKLRAEPRMAFIQSVGEAAKVLTDEQRQMLLGTMEPDASPANAPAGK